MSKLLFIVVMIIGLAFFGCGEQADQADNGDTTDNGEVVEGDNGDETVDTGETQGDSEDQDQGTTTAASFDLDTPEMAVGQWIEYSADDMSESLTISVVGNETNQGTDCYWIQVSASDFVAQLLVDPVGIESAMDKGTEKFGEFAADPAAYIRENMADTEGMANMFGDEESMESALEFIKAIRIVKFEQDGMVMAIDLAGVPEFLDGMMDDPAFQEQFQQGFAQGFESEGGQEGLDEIMAELDVMQFGFSDTDVEVAGNRIHGMEFTIEHPEGVVEAVLSSELPLVPLAYAEITSLDDNETHFVEVVGYGFSGAENLLPGEPAQTLPAMMFLQGMEQQMGGMGN